MKQLASLTSQPLQLIDVGARAGVHPRWKRLRKEFPIKVIGFEADNRECTALNNLGEEGIRFLPWALASKEDNRVLNVLVNESSSSLHKPNYAFVNRTVAAAGYKIKREAAVSTRTLDAVLDEDAISGVDFMKIDTEGYELEILLGATRTLQQVFAIELEVWFNRVFVGAPLFRDIDAFMAGHGFVLLDLARSNNRFKRQDGATLGGPKGQLVAGDALYFRDLAGLPADNIFFERGKLVRSVILLIQYAYYDVALEFANLARKHGTVDEQEHSIIRKYIQTAGERSMFDFPGKHTLEKAVNRLGRWLSKFEGDYLGNW